MAITRSRSVRPFMLDSMCLDILVCIAEKLGLKDLKSLHLVCRLFRSAVGDGAIKLRPGANITSWQLVTLGNAFPNATSLDLSNCSLLVNGSLR